MSLNQFKLLLAGTFQNVDKVNLTDQVLVEPSTFGNTFG